MKQNNNNYNTMEVQLKDGIPVVDSRLVAKELGINHIKTFIPTIRKYKDEFEEMGVLLFEQEKPIEGSQGGQPELFCWLNEDQATYAMTLSKNTDTVRKCKRNLVKAFSEAKKQLQGNDSALENIPSGEADMSNLGNYLTMMGNAMAEVGNAVNDLYQRDQEKQKQLDELNVDKQLYHELASLRGKYKAGNYGSDFETVRHYPVFGGNADFIANILGYHSGLRDKDECNSYYYPIEFLELFTRYNMEDIRRVANRLRVKR